MGGSGDPMEIAVKLLSWTQFRGLFLPCTPGELGCISEPPLPHFEVRIAAYRFVEMIAFNELSMFPVQCPHQWQLPFLEGAPLSNSRRIGLQIAV